MSQASKGQLIWGDSCMAVAFCPMLKRPHHDGHLARHTLERRTSTQVCLLLLVSARSEDFPGMKDYLCMAADRPNACNAQVWILLKRLWRQRQAPTLCALSSSNLSFSMEWRNSN